MKITKLIRLAQDGDIDAQYKVAEMYWSGRGALIDTDKAWYWCKKAAQLGHSKATQLMKLLQTGRTQGRV